MMGSVARLHPRRPLLVMMMVSSFAIAAGATAAWPTSGRGGAATSVRVVVVMQRMVVMMTTTAAFRHAGVVPLGGSVGNFGYSNIFVHTDGKRICGGQGNKDY